MDCGVRQGLMPARSAIGEIACRQRSPDLVAAELDQSDRIGAFGGFANERDPLPCCARDDVCFRSDLERCAVREEHHFTIGLRCVRERDVRLDVSLFRQLRDNPLASRPRCKYLSAVEPLHGPEFERANVPLLDGCRCRFRRSFRRCLRGAGFRCRCRFRGDRGLDRRTGRS